MIFGVSSATYTVFHVLISLAAIFIGLVAVSETLRGRISMRVQALYLITTALTSLTGFFFHSKFGPPHVIGIISLLVLAIASYALALRSLSGRWRSTYVIAAWTALYLNVFVGIIQAFQKVGFIHALAPTQKEPPFALVQGAVLLGFIALTVLAIKRFRPTYSGSRQTP